MMPEMDGFEVCRRIKANPSTALLPVIMVTALSDQSDRVAGLEAGADDFLTKPVGDLALFARPRSLLQVKLLLDELRLREKTSCQMNIRRGVENCAKLMHSKRVLFVGEDPSEGELIAEIFDENIHLDALSDSTEAMQKALKLNYDMVSVSLSLIDSDSLRLCFQVCSNVATLYIPILVIVENSEPELVTKALELGVSDHTIRPIDLSEALARAPTQSSYRRYHEELRGALEKIVDMAVTDGLTRLYNRRYVTHHLAGLAQDRSAENRNIALTMVDIDHFKMVKDTHGHDVGDQVLKEI